MMLESGLPVDRALQLCDRQHPSRPAAPRDHDCRWRRCAVASSSPACCARHVFSGFYASLLEVGEESGELGKVFNEIARPQPRCLLELDAARDDVARARADPADGPDRGRRRGDHDAEHYVRGGHRPVSHAPRTWIHARRAAGRPRDPRFRDRAGRAPHGRSDRQGARAGRVARARSAPCGTGIPGVRRMAGTSNCVAKARSSRGSWGMPKPGRWTSHTCSSIRRRSCSSTRTVSRSPAA